MLFQWVSSLPSYLCSLSSPSPYPLWLNLERLDFRIAKWINRTYRPEAIVVPVRCHCNLSWSHSAQLVGLCLSRLQFCCEPHPLVAIGSHELARRSTAIAVGTANENEHEDGDDEVYGVMTPTGNGGRCMTSADDNVRMN